ncbi:winged helix-turn-helix transcriptional regulator [Streptomyces sp. NPDC054835]|uniref:winged helix-turn-helix transcriptional regulator n=1 Tax=Streptomyces exfoliatus TaxID=1905 RepID=UPI0004637A90|nr:helix-turn-helix domain-containing protein [Streptomyces exfoliatus]
MAAARALSPDLRRVVETLEMISPRWSVWMLMTLASEPHGLRYSDVQSRLPWLIAGQITPRLRALCEVGLLERTALSNRHVTYGLTDRGRDLLPTLHALAEYGDQHLDKRLVATKVVKDGKEQVVELPERIPAAQNAEDALALISYKHATPLLWALKERGPSSIVSLRKTVLPGYSPSAVYPPSHKLIDDRLVTARQLDWPTGAEDEGMELRLTDAAHALAPIYRAASTWASGRPNKDSSSHPLWGKARRVGTARSGQWAAYQVRQAPRAVVPVAQPPAPAPVKMWRPGDLFSSPMTGPCR